MKKILLPHQFYFPYLDIIKEIASPDRLHEFGLSLAGESSRKGIIYVHIPFCNSECTFCGFDKSYNLSELSRYIEVLKAEIDLYSVKTYVKSLEFTGVHIGGGTPTLLPNHMLGDLIDYVRSSFNAEDVPLHIECSAGTVGDGMVDLLKEKSVSRVSMGVQTFNPALRRQLDIMFSLDQTCDALSRLKRAEITTYIDVMYGFPDLGVGDQLGIVESDVRTALDMGVDGIDLSQFYPFHNPLEYRIVKEGLRFPSSNDLVNTIVTATSILEQAGYLQSSEYVFCRSGNIILEKAYFGDWDCMAVGSGSLGLLNGFKYRNKNYSQYLKSSVPGILSLRKLAGDELQRIPIVGFPRLLRLRKDMLSERLKRKYMNKLDELISMGMLEETDESFELTDTGKAYINNIYFMMMDTTEQEEIERRLKILRLS